jgi:hypothetical protein
MARRFYRVDGFPVVKAPYHRPFPDKPKGKISLDDKVATSVF